MRAFSVTTTKQHATQLKHIMQRKQNVLGTLIKASLCAILALGIAAQARAEDKKADPTGTWTWTGPSRNGNPGAEFSLKLKADGDKVTGTLTAPGRGGGQPTDTEITDGKLKGDEVSFSVTRTRGGNSFTTKYSGKISGDSIKGKTESERNGETQSRDWEAKRKTS
jgi:hypothetical protein